jgi:hypothetical protein
MITRTDSSLAIEAENLDGFIDPQDLRKLQAEIKERIGDLQGIAKYCSLKADAMELRLKGNIPLAARFEDHCEQVYKTLPKWAKW